METGSLHYWLSVFDGALGIMFPLERSGKVRGPYPSLEAMFGMHAWAGRPYLEWTNSTLSSLCPLKPTRCRGGVQLSAC